MWSNSLPDSSTLKIGGNAKKEKLKWDILSDFQTVWGSEWWQFDMNIRAYFSSAIQTWNWIWNVSTVLGFLLCSTLALLFWWPLNLLFVLSRDNSLQQWGYFFTHYLSLIAFPRGSGNLKPEKNDLFVNFTSIFLPLKGQFIYLADNRETDLSSLKPTNYAL